MRVAFDTDDLVVLARTIEAEAGGEPLDVQVALANLIVNRVQKGKKKFGGKTIKGVCEAIGNAPEVDDRKLESILNWLPKILNGTVEDTSEGCLYYNNPYKNNSFDATRLEFHMDLGHLRQMDQQSQQRLRKEYKRYLKTRRSHKQSVLTAKELKSRETTAKQQRRTKQKQMKKENIPKMKRLEDEEVEQFEVVPGASPALCQGKRKPKMKWKKEDDDKVEQAAYDDDSDVDNKDSNGKNIVEQIRRGIEEGRAAMQKQIETDKANKKEMDKLLGQVRKKTKKGDQSLSQGDDELDEATKMTVTKILKVLKQNQLLDRVLSPPENTSLSVFFTSENPPSEEILKTLDKAMTKAIEKLVTSPHEIEDIIDNKMRELLLNQDLAKNLLLEVMLAEPGFIPVNWGGNVLCGNETKKVAEKKPPLTVVQSYSLAAKK